MDLYKEVVKKNELTESEFNTIKFRSYLPSLFIAAALPLRDVKSNIFERKYNNVNLKISGATKVPYGKNGRLILSLITTYSVLNVGKSEKILVSFDSIKNLCTELQLPKQRGTEVLEQLELFSTSSFIYQGFTEITNLQKSLFDDDDRISKCKITEVRTGQVPFLNDLRYLKYEMKNGFELKGITFEINEKFAKLASEHAVPINYTVYKDISSAVGKDLYAWLCYRVNSFDKTNESILIPKESLIRQFMPINEKLDDDSKKALLSKNYAYLVERLKEIKENYYPQLNISFLKDNTGVMLYKSPRPVLASDKESFVLVTDILPK